jgi:hypothetical protein
MLDRSTDLFSLAPEAPSSAHCPLHDHQMLEISNPRFAARYQKTSTVLPFTASDEKKQYFNPPTACIEHNALLHHLSDSPDSLPGSLSSVFANATICLRSHM